MPMLVSDTGTTFFSGTLLGLLLALVVLCLVVITVLAVIVVRQRRQIASKNKSIVRNASLYLSLKHKDFPNLGGGRPEAELSQVELVSLMQLIRKMLYGCVLLLPAAPAMAQESTDTTYVFRFVPTDDMFYVPLGNNEAELQRLEDTVEKYYDDILAGDIPIRVDGYCNSGGDRKTNLKQVGTHQLLLGDGELLHHEEPFGGRRLCAGQAGRSQTPVLPAFFFRRWQRGSFRQQCECTGKYSQ